MTNILEFSPKLREIVRQFIDSGWVSVYVGPDGEFHEYVVVMDETELCLRRTYIGRDIEYVIEYDERVIACVTVSASAKVRTVPETEIIQLFNLCSARVIAQEMRTRILDCNQKQFS